MTYPTTAHRIRSESRRTERVYSAMARVYDGFFDWALEPGRVRALHALAPRAGDRVLEVGVGTGLSLPLYPDFVDVVGIDISEGMLRQARRRREELGLARVALQTMDAGALAFEDASFDRVLAPYVISVVPDPERVMAEIARVCRPGGTVVVVNHFRSDNRVVAGVESLLTPASRWIGFRMDLPEARILRGPALELVERESVNLLGMWRVLTLRKTI